MISIGGRRVLLGGFHDHWARTNTDNPALLLAALNYYHYDFVCLMDGEDERWIASALETWCPGFRAFVGHEETQLWGHVITVGIRQKVVLSPETPPRETFSAYEAACEFVAMAHPAMDHRVDGTLDYEQVGELMDEGVIRATQIDLADVPRAWFRAREKAGKITPIVSGWDVHLVYPLPGLPDVLYGPDRKPDGHLDSCGGSRTLVLAEENTFPAIRAAVLRGDSLVENLKTGELLGPGKWVRFLEEHGYRDAIAQLNARRDATLLAAAGPAVVGEPVSLTFPAACRVRLPGTLREPVERDTAADGTLDTHLLPALLDRDLTYMPVVQVQPDGYARAWAVALHHPVQVDMLPKVVDGRQRIELQPRRPFHGRYTLTVEGAPELIHGDETQLEVDMPIAPASHGTVAGKLEAGSKTGVVRTSETTLGCVIAPRFRGGWDSVPTTLIADTCAPKPLQQYGANRPYPGADVFSARLQIAWTPETFFARTTVVDAVHFQPVDGHRSYHADSLQLALDPLLKREDGIGAVYVFNSCLGPNGPELFRWLRPNPGLAAGYHAPEYNTTMGNRYVTIEPWEKGLVYTIALPWTELAPAQPAPGLRMGLYMLLFNNDGHGLLDTLHWPRPRTGMWLVPRRWGIVSLEG